MPPNVQQPMAALPLVLDELRTTNAHVETMVQEACSTTDAQILSVGKSVQQIFQESDAYDREFSELSRQFTDEGAGTFASAIQRQADLTRAMPAAFESILGRSKEVVAHVAEAQGMIQEILKLVGGIEDIALSVKMLSINARIEAARAGEVGRGFAIVAETMRELSQRVAVANSSIHQLGVNVGTLLPVMSEAAKKTATLCEDQTDRVRSAVEVVQSQYDDARGQVVATLDVNRQRGESFRSLSAQLLEQIQFGDIVVQQLRAAVAEAKHPQEYVEALATFLESNPDADADAITQFWGSLRTKWLESTGACRQRRFAVHMVNEPPDDQRTEAEGGSVQLF